MSMRGGSSSLGMEPRPSCDELAAPLRQPLFFGLMASPID